MSIIKEKIRFVGDNMNLKISFGSNDAFTGRQQEIDNLTQFKSLESVNSITDAETRKFKLNPDTSTQVIQFYFHAGGGSYPITPNFTSAGFTLNEINSSALSFLNSFFILECYDTFDINTQTKIFTTYLTKKGTVPSYSITDKSNQLYYWYIPVSYIAENTGTTQTAYTKFSFFNAKTGKLIVFYNQDRESDLTPRRMFFDTQLNIENKFWKIIPTTIRAREIRNNQYVEKMNKTYDSFDNLLQVYPTGNTFTYSGSSAFYLTT